VGASMIGWFSRTEQILIEHLKGGVADFVARLDMFSGCGCFQDSRVVTGARLWLSRIHWYTKFISSRPGGGARVNPLCVVSSRPGLPPRAACHHHLTYAHIHRCTHRHANTHARAHTQCP
jgi:hypothetical protein